MSKIRSFVEKHKDVLSLLGCLALYGALAYLLRLPCPIKKATGISCPGCGMSRALISLVTLDFSAAIYYHPLVFFLLPVVVCLVVFYERKMIKARRVLVAVSVAALIGVYLYRMIVAPSPVVEFAPENSMIAWLWTRVRSWFW